MTTLQDLLDELKKLDVNPDEVRVRGREYGSMLQRAEDVVDTDDDDSDGDG